MSFLKASKITQNRLTTEIQAEIENLLAEKNDLLSKTMILLSKRSLMSTQPTRLSFLFFKICDFFVSLDKLDVRKLKMPSPIGRKRGLKEVRQSKCMRLQFRYR